MIYTNSMGRKYKLVKNAIKLKNETVNIYYFVGDDSLLPKGGKYIDELPKGYKIVESKKSHGFPLIVRDYGNK